MKIMSKFGCNNKLLETNFFANEIDGKDRLKLLWTHTEEPDQRHLLVHRST